MKRFLLPALALAAVAAIWVYVASVEETAITGAVDDVAADRSAGTLPGGAQIVQSMEDVMLEGVNANGERWVLTARTVASDAKADIGELIDVQMKMYTASGVMEGHADRASRSALGGLHFNGNITLSRQGWRAALDSAIYYPDTALVSSEGPVAVFSDTAVVKGRGLLVDLNKSTVRIFNDVHATLTGTVLPEYK